MDWMTSKKEFPPCFGDLNTVFSKGADGLRHTPPSCLACRHKTMCLRAAMQSSQGLQVRDEFIDRAYDSGMMRFFERWAKKKDIHRKSRENGDKKT